MRIINKFALIFLRGYKAFLTNQEVGVKHHVTQLKSSSVASLVPVELSKVSFACANSENVADQIVSTEADSKLDLNLWSTNLDHVPRIVQAYDIQLGDTSGVSLVIA